MAHHHRPTKEILAEMLAATQIFSEGAAQADDMTAVIIKRLPSVNLYTSPISP